MRFRHPRTGSSVKSPSRRERPLPRTGSSPRSSFGDRRRLEEMPQALFLRPQVADVRSCDANLEGDAFRHPNAVRAGILNLRGAVCRKRDLDCTEDPQHACGTLLTTTILRNTEGP